MNHIQLTPTQQEALSLSRHIVVTAGAGTGKTEVLIQRIIKILSQVNHINQVLAITYTDKAAGEIKHRVYRAILEQMNTTHGAEQEKFERMREQFLKNYISTIHAFCATVIRRFPQEIEGLDPDFGILEGYEQRILLRENIETLLDEIARNKEHPLRGDLRNVLFSRNKRVVMRMLEELVNRRREVYSWIEKINSSEEQELKEQQEQLAMSYSQSVFNKLKETPAIQSVLTELEECIPQKSAEKDSAYKRQRVVLGGFRSENTIPELVEELFDSQGNVRGTGRLGSQAVWGKDTVIRIRNVFGELGNMILPYRDQLQIHFDAEVDDNSIAVLKGLASLADNAIQRYQNAKMERGVLDFNDLELYATQLLENPSILQTLQNQFRYILVDEFQDTNQFQWNMIRQLVMQPETDQFTADKLFIVGDEKQSIYSFRGSDVEVCDVAKEELLACNLKNASNGNNGIIGFDVNFRSQPNLLYFFNRFFTHLFTSQFNRDTLTKIERYEAEPQDLSYKKDDAFIFPDTPIDMPEQGTIERFITHTAKHGQKFDEDEEEGIRDDLKEAMMIAARLRAIMDCHERSNGKMNEKYGDLAEKLHNREKAVGILFRRRTKQKLYEETLRSYNVPYVVAKGRGFYEQQEILDIANALRFLTDPRQDIALVGVLRSPLIGCSDNGLFNLSQQEGEGYWQKLRSLFSSTVRSGIEPIVRSGVEPLNNEQFETPPTGFSEHDTQALKKAYALFEKWFQLKDRVSISELIVHIVRDTGAMMTFARGSDGVQAISNVEKLIDLARKYESQGMYTLTDFTDYLHAQITAEEEESEADLPEGGGVQLMTVHQAKGLQFPMVIVPDTNAYFRYDEGMLIGQIEGQTEVGLQMTKFDGDEADTAIRQILRAENRKRTIAEQKRLLYVAFTRAEDHLIICQKIAEDSKPKPITKANCWGDWIQTIFEGDKAFAFFEDTVYNEDIVRKEDDVSMDAQPVEFDSEFLYPVFIDPMKAEVTVTQKLG
ncbi:MAG: UvrD-helicase domain-containing protein, partial [Deltaproteobacteria bacterium]|nr:UvrD-helicase domain-containing protein [Deltaproteobacteria bacterium]